MLDRATAGATLSSGAPLVEDTECVRSRAIWYSSQKSWPGEKNGTGLPYLLLSYTTAPAFAPLPRLSRALARWSAAGPLP